ncbi:MAG: GNAT family N-acetyltransferase [Phycisphaerales bacterium]|nr:GNAT family N-acetyltransferase [Phycisphaerales bacterium]
MKFVEILQDGSLAEPTADLPEVASGVLGSTRDHYGRTGFSPPWVGYMVQSNDASGTAQWVGTCAFTAAPKDGRVEIAYFTFPDFEGRGIATQMARKLLEIARQNDSTLTITAFTLAEKNASNSILKKLGFDFAGVVEHPEDGTIWEWTRPAH